MTPDQAERIRAFEGAAASPEASAPGLSPAIEAIAYLGVVLALAAMFAAWGQLDEGTGRVMLTGLSTLGLALAGWVLGRGPDTSFRRLGATLWLLATGTVAFATADSYLAASETEDLPDVASFGVGVSMAVVGWLGYAFRPHAVTHLAAFAGTAAAGVGLALWIAGDDEPASMGVALFVLGAIWYRLADRLASPAVGKAMATFALVLAPLFVRFITIDDSDAPTSFALLLGVGVAAVTTALGIRARGWGGLAIGGVALFCYSTAAIVHFFGDTLGAPVALLLAGVLMLGVAVVVTRLRGRGRPGASGSAPPPTAT
jgi:hypothetical protein